MLNFGTFSKKAFLCNLIIKMPEKCGEWVIKILHVLQRINILF